MTGLMERDGVIVLPDRMDIAAAGILRDTVLGETRDLVLDAAGVSVVTSPALQVLMATRDHQHANDKSVAISNPSSGFVASIRILGVSLSRLETGGGVT